MDFLLILDTDMKLMRLRVIPMLKRPSSAQLLFNEKRKAAPKAQS